MKGRIVKNISNDYVIKSENKLYNCKPRGKLRNEDNIPLVGDIVEFDPDKLVINKILPRKNELIRPPVSNIDICVIVTSTKEPNLDTYLLDKILTIVSYNNIVPVIYFTKKDLLNKQELNELKDFIKYYKSIGYKVANNQKELLRLIKSKTVVLAGQSGAGKSTLLNQLDKTLNLKTATISHALGRGKHTTRHTEMYSIKNSFIVDTPGFSKIDLSIMTDIELRDNMNEFFTNTKHCKYKDCKHIKEDGCYVKKQIKKNKIMNSRYNNYISFLKEKNIRR